MGSLETIQSGAENCKALMSWDEGGGYRTTSDLSGVVRFDFESMGGAFCHQEAPTTHDHHPRAPPTLAPAIHSPVSEFAVVSNSSVSEFLSQRSVTPTIFNCHSCCLVFKFLENSFFSPLKSEI